MQGRHSNHGSPGLQTGLAVLAQTCTRIRTDQRWHDSTELVIHHLGIAHGKAQRMPLRRHHLRLFMQAGSSAVQRRLQHEVAICGEHYQWRGDLFQQLPKLLTVRLTRTVCR
ncbi:hypothetical protein D3C78_1583590 [compost metagenome]